MMSGCLTLCVALVAAAGAAAVEPPRTLGHEIRSGDWVVTTADCAPVQANRDVLFVLGTGTELRAEGVNGEWIAVTVLQDGERVRGWVQAKHLAVLALKSQGKRSTPDALSSVEPQERYIAFSLNVARRQLGETSFAETSSWQGLTARGLAGLFARMIDRNVGDAQQAPERTEPTRLRRGSRAPDAEVLRLGGITRVCGLVVDPKTGDAILVGQYIPGRAPLTLDDLVVALRARFVHAEWPVVSIDPPPTRNAPRIHTVRFEGGVENTIFGQTLFDADYLLKRIGLGNVSTGVRSVRSHWDLAGEESRKRNLISWSTHNRFWFYPVAPAVPVRDNVAALDEVKMGVFRELMGATVNGQPVADLSKVKNEAAETFVTMIRNHYRELAAIHPPFRRLEQLNELVGLTCAIEAMRPKPDLSWWLDRYRVESRNTPTTVNELSRHETYRQSDGNSRSHTLSGGVELRALALRLKAGDVSALRDAVLKTRPGPDVLCWEFVATDWVVPVPSRSAAGDVAAITQQFMYARFLIRQKHFEEALESLETILRTDPNFVDAWYVKGVLFSRHLKQYKDAIECFDVALEKNPDSAEFHATRGLAYISMGNTFRASRDLDQALHLNPKLAIAFAARGYCHAQRGKYDRALADVDEALRLNGGLAIAFATRGKVFRMQGETEKATAELNAALRLDPNQTMARAEFALIHSRRNEHGKAVQEYTEIIRANPNLVAAYYRRARAHEGRGDHAKAAADYSEVIRRAANPKEAYFRRGEAYRKTRQFDKALADSLKADLLLFLEVASENAPLKIGPKTVGTAIQGESLQVFQVKGKWLHAESTTSDGDVVRGWIDQRHVR